MKKRGPGIGYSIRIVSTNSQLRYITLSELHSSTWCLPEATYVIVEGEFVFPPNVESEDEFADVDTPTGELFVHIDQYTRPFRCQYKHNGTNHKIMLERVSGDLPYFKDPM